MRRRTILLIVAAFAVVILVVSILGRIVSGGDKTFLAVVAVIETNSFVAGRVGSPVIAVDKNDGPWRVLLAQDGHRSGYYSVTVTGPKGKEALKAYWREISNGQFEVYSIYKTAPFAQDQLLWGVPGQS
jgi:hypothetical protein